jgi:hypothetical protein
VITKTSEGYEIAGDPVVHRIVPRAETRFRGKVWNAKRCTFDGRDYWLGAIETNRGKLLAVAGPDDINGSMEDAIRFCVKQASNKALGPIDIEVRTEKK